MACDYASIREDNKRRYGSDIGRIGPMLLADRYADRTHFIFELLQNAEDALSRRVGWDGPRAVSFTLSNGVLRVSHFGNPFDERDVRGICGIAESSKSATALGRFGIGFKSVYAFADKPEVHSGHEDFAIENFVWPASVLAVDRGGDETVIVLPLRDGDDVARHDIVRGFQSLGPGTLLFLREIDEIAWSVDDGPSGLYLRDKPVDLGEGVRRVVVIGQEAGGQDIEQTWLVFSREARTEAGLVAGQMEIAFALAKNEERDNWSVCGVGDSPLVVFFPTVLSTNLGFLVQGPYRTTPSRDNVPREDPWNRHLVQETAGLLVEALRWMRDHDLLDTSALRCLPLDGSRFGSGSMFGPMFAETRRALASEPLLPRHGGGHVAASSARLARTQDLRVLLSSDQLASVFDHDGKLAWLSGDVTQDRTPELSQYLMRELDISEISPETIVPRLEKPFLESLTTNSGKAGIMGR